MIAYTFKRLASFVPTVLVATLLVFFFIRAIPGDPAAVMLGDGATPEAIAQLREKLGLNHPLFWQYFVWLAALAQGDFGQSLFFPPTGVTGDWRWGGDQPLFGQFDHVLGVDDWGAAGDVGGQLSPPLVRSCGVGWVDVGGIGADILVGTLSHFGVCRGFGLVPQFRFPVLGGRGAGQFALFGVAEFNPGCTQFGLDLAVGALVNARCAARGLYTHRPRQGIIAHAGGMGPYLSQCLGWGGGQHRIYLCRLGVRSGRYRDGVFPAWDWAIDCAIDLTARLSGPRRGHVGDDHLLPGG